MTQNSVNTGGVWMKSPPTYVGEGDICQWHGNIATAEYITNVNDMDKYIAQD